MKKRKKAGHIRAWMQISLSILMSGSLLMGPGALGASALAEGDYQTFTKDLGNERVVVYPNVIQTTDPKTGVTTMSKKRDKIRDALKITQQYQLVGYQESSQSVDVYTPKATGIPKVGESYKGGTVTDVQTTHDDTNHKTVVSVMYNTTQNLTEFPKKGDAYNGGTVTGVTVSYTNRDVYTPSTTGIPKKGDSYKGGTVTGVTTTHDDATHKTTATVKYDTTATVYTASTAGIPKVGDNYGGGKVTSVTTTHDDATHKTAATVKYDTTATVYTSSTAGIPKVGDAYNGGTVTGVTTTHDDVTHKTTATIKYDTTSTTTQSQTIPLVPVYTSRYAGQDTYKDVISGYNVTIEGKTIAATPVYTSKYVGQDTYRDVISGYSVTYGGKTTKATPVYTSKYVGQDTYRDVISGYKVTLDIPTTTTASNTATATAADTTSTSTTNNATTLSVADTSSTGTTNNTTTVIVDDIKSTESIATSATVTYDTTQDVYVASTTGIPKKGDSYKGGTVTSVTTRHDDVNRETNATIRYDVITYKNEPEKVYDWAYTSSKTWLYDSPTAISDWISSMQQMGYYIDKTYDLSYSSKYGKPTVSFSHDEHYLAATYTGNTVLVPHYSSKLGTMSVPDTKSAKTISSKAIVNAGSTTTLSNTFEFEVADTKGVKQVTVATPKYDWVVVKSEPTTTVSTDYVSAGPLVAPTHAMTMSPVPSGRGTSIFLSDSGRGGVLGGSKVRAMLRANDSVASQASVRAPSQKAGSARNSGSMVFSTNGKLTLAEATKSIKGDEDSDHKAKGHGNQNDGDLEKMSRH